MPADSQQEDEYYKDLEASHKSFASDSDLHEAYIDRFLNDNVGDAIDSVLLEEPLEDLEADRDFSDPSLEITCRTILVENLPPSKPLRHLKKILGNHNCPSPEKVISVYGIGDQPRRVVVQFLDPETAVKVAACDGASCADRKVSFRLYNPIEDALSSLKCFEPVSPRSGDEMCYYLNSLSEIVERQYNASKPGNVVLAKREQLMAQLRAILNEPEIFNRLLKHVDYLPDDGSPGLKLELFGSVPSLISSRTSDLDVCIVGESLDSLAVLKEWIRVLRRKRLGQLQFIGRARVPVIKLSHRATRLEVDFTVKDDVINQRLKTWLLQACARKDERVVRLIILIKFWSKQRDIGDASTGTLNSFGFSLLVIHFLQCGCADPILPRIISDGPIPVSDGSQNPFETERFLNWTTKNKQSIGELVYDFFQYYATKWDVTSEIISVRDCARRPMPLPLRAGKFHKTHKWLMVIQDPFDHHDNIARNVNQDAVKRIITEMRRAYDLMRRCTAWSVICETALELRPKPKPYDRSGHKKDHNFAKWKKKPPTNDVPPDDVNNQHHSTGQTAKIVPDKRKQLSLLSPKGDLANNSKKNNEGPVAAKDLKSNTRRPDTRSKTTKKPSDEDRPSLLDESPATNRLTELVARLDLTISDEAKENISNSILPESHPASKNTIRRMKKKEKIRNASIAAQHIIKAVAISADAEAQHITANQNVPGPSLPPTRPKKKRNKKKPSSSNAGQD